MYCTRRYITISVVSTPFTTHTNMDADRRLSPSRDCFSCKIIGAGGCFAGALYAIYLRAQMPATRTSRHWLVALSVGQSSHDVCGTTTCTCVCCVCTYRSSWTGGLEVDDVTDCNIASVCMYIIICRKPKKVARTSYVYG